jgi:hypothetical protein
MKAAVIVNIIIELDMWLTSAVEVFLEDDNKRETLSRADLNPSLHALAFRCFRVARLSVLDVRLIAIE